MNKCPAMPNPGNNTSVMWAVCSITLFTAFQFYFGTIFCIIFTQKGNFPVSGGFPLVVDNQRAQATLIKSLIHLGLVQILDPCVLGDQCAIMFCFATFFMFVNVTFLFVYPQN